MKYNPVEIEQMLKSMSILVDTREQENARFKKRVGAFTCPYHREKLDFGDYSAEYIDINGNVKSLKNIAVVERKMSLDEISNNFTVGRKRFTREFERANGCNIHLLIENASYNNVFNHIYKSKLNSNSMLASLLTFQIRYKCNLHYVNKENSGKLIEKILYYELREYLLNLEEVEGCG